MKIALITPLQSFAPTTKRVLEYEDNLLKRGYDIKVIMPYDPELEILDYVDLKHIRFSAFLTISSFFNTFYKKKYGNHLNISNVIKMSQIGPFLTDCDIVHCFKPYHNSVIALLSKLTNRSKIILDLDDIDSLYTNDFGTIKRFIYNRFENVLTKRADLNIVCSDFLREYLINKNVNPSRIKILPISTNTSFFDAKEKKYSIYIPRLHGSKIITFIGNLMKFQDIDLVIKAMKIITKEIPNCKLLVIGDGPNRQDLEKLSLNLGVDKDVLFVGSQPHSTIPNFLFFSDVLVLPLRENTGNKARFPTKLVEYMSSGKPIVASNVGVVGKIIIHGENGLLSTPGDYENLAYNILSILKNKDFAVSLGSNAKRTSKAYDTNVITNDLIRLYEGLL